MTMVHSRYGVEAARPEIWVYLEREPAGGLAAVSLELLSKARELADEAGWPAAGLLFGEAVEGLAEEAIAHGADRLMISQHPELATFRIESYAATAYAALMAFRPSIFLVGATPDGRDLAGRLAVRLRTGLNADCSDLRLDLERGVLISEVSGFGGGVLALIEMAHHRPQMATVRPGVFTVTPADPTRRGEVVPVDYQPGTESWRTTVVEHMIGERLDLTQTPILVAGGRGIDGQFAMLQELADLLGGDVGATRPPVDEGFIERERQIGQTGIVCRPKVAIACGISGAFHFLVGIQEAEIVIAINSDPNAPIFDSADYCVLADVHQIVPALTAILRAGARPGKQTLVAAGDPQVPAGREGKRRRGDDV